MSDAAEKDEKVTTIWIGFAPDEVDALVNLVAEFGLVAMSADEVARIAVKLARAGVGEASDASRPG